MPRLRLQSGPVVPWICGAPRDAARRLADLSAAVRDYLTNETEIGSPSFHATAITHRLAPLITKRGEVLARIEALADELETERPSSSAWRGAYRNNARRLRAALEGDA